MNTSFEMNALENIAQVLDYCGMPLTGDQQSVLAGALSVWINKAYLEGLGEKSRTSGGEGGIRTHVTTKS